MRARQNQYVLHGLLLPRAQLTEQTFEELRHIYPLTEWIQRDPDRAAKVLGKNNTKLRLPEVRRVVWQLRIRHTNFQLRAIWKYCNERCWELAPYGKLCPPCRIAGA